MLSLRPLRANREGYFNELATFRLAFFGLLLKEIGFMGAMSRNAARITLVLAFFLAIGLTTSLCASEIDPAESSEATAVDWDAKIDKGDNAWILTSSALVLMMTAPGLALFYCGLVRKKNVLSVMMQCVFLMCLMTIVWAVIGYSLAFGEGNPYIGNFDYFMMNNVQLEWGKPTPMFGSIPLMTHMLFQGMFFIITPALMCGAFAERMKFSTMAVFSVLWGLLVYCPLCHWIWCNGGWLQYGAEGALAGGVLDFAGGLVVHLSSGVSALIAALLIGKRVGFGSEAMPPHNMTYTTIGAALLWVGWFGFNGGSALSSGALAANAFAVTHFGAAAGGITWAGLEWILRGKPSVLGACTGLVAGLAGVTATTGFIQPIYGILAGVICTLVCYFACTVVKNKFGYDDSLDVFGVHGVSGFVGILLIGFFATRDVTDPAVSGGQYLGMFEGGSVIVGQIVGIALTLLLSIVVTFILLKVLDAIMGLRVDHRAEIEGLDLNDHGEEGYILY